MKSARNSYTLICILLILGAIAYYYRDDFSYAKPYIESIKNTLHPIKPCKDVITYSIGTFDPQFGLSQEQFLNVVDEAKKTWEDAEGKTLFQYEADGDMKINLIYDYRQQATDQLEKVGISINDDRSTYNELKARYDSLTATYTREKAKYTSDMADYQTKSASYQKKVEYYNSHGGAPEAEYNSLKQQQDDLNSEAAAINSEQDTLNATADSVNTTATVLNNVATKLNMKVENYNDTASSTGEEFDEGEYVRDSSGSTHIDIYQFEDEEKLKRVLIHELGHALGLEHVDDPNAIMYKLNTSTNDTLTAADLAELKKACGTN